MATHGLLFLCGALSATGSLTSAFPGWLIASLAGRVWNFASSRLPGT
jgi:hypothetical protein